MNDDIDNIKQRSIQTPTGCWEWNGARTSAGYGEISRGGKVRYVHRLSWEIHRSPIPKGQHVLHRCDNPPCWNPDHLFLGTNQDNTDDKIAKGRMRHGHLYGDQHPARTHPETFLKYGEDHWAARITVTIARQVRADWAGGTMRKVDIARKFNINRGTVHHIIAGKNWKE
jgi:hypothetical protein